METSKPSKKQRDKMIHKAREQYRQDLEKTRKESGCNIPFGANLEPFKKIKE